MEQQDFDKFKEGLLEYLQDEEQITGCKIIADIENCYTSKALSKVLEKHIDTIAEHFDHEPEWDSCPNCMDKDDEIYKLEDKVEDLEEIIRDSPQTIQEELKTEAFDKYRYLYNDQELEYLLSRGKELLINKDIYETTQ